MRTRRQWWWRATVAGFCAASAVASAQRPSALAGYPLIDVLVWGIDMKIDVAGLQARTTISFLRPKLECPDSERMQTAQLGSWMKSHRRLFQFPSWSCGGLSNEGGTRTVETSFRELQVELLAARLDVPTNSVYTSRQLKDCQAEARGAVQAEFEDDVLYVLNRADVIRTIPLAALASSPACVDVCWGLVCSRSWLNRQTTLNEIR